MEDRQIILSMHLTDPIPFAGSSMEELVFYEPKTRLLDEIESNDRTGEQALAIVSSLTGVPIETLHLLGLEDGFKAVAIGGDIVEKKSQAATKFLRSIGIIESDPEEEALEVDARSPSQPETLNAV